MLAKFGGLEIPNVDSVDQYGSRTRVEHSRDEIYQRTFTASCVTDYSYGHSGRNAKIDVVQCGSRPEFYVHFPKLDFTSHPGNRTGRCRLSQRRLLLHKRVNALHGSRTALHQV